MKKLIRLSDDLFALVIPHMTSILRLKNLKWHEQFLWDFFDSLCERLGRNECQKQLTELICCYLDHNAASLSLVSILINWFGLPFVLRTFLPYLITRVGYPEQKANHIIRRSIEYSLMPNQYRALLKCSSNCMIGVSCKCVIYLSLISGPVNVSRFLLEPLIKQIIKSDGEVRIVELFEIVKMWHFDMGEPFISRIVYPSVIFKMKEAYILDSRKSIRTLVELLNLLHFLEMLLKEWGLNRYILNLLMPLFPILVRTCPPLTWTCDASVSEALFQKMLDIIVICSFHMDLKTWERSLLSVVSDFLDLCDQGVMQPDSFDEVEKVLF